MKIIIPMAGESERFRKAGYAIPKPLILVDGKPMIEHVIDLFPGEEDFVFVCNSNDLQNTNLRSVLLGKKPKAKIIEIEFGKFGPVWSVVEALKKEDFLDDGPTIVNYCDFGAFWDYEAFKAKMKETNCDGCITAYKGFHPHSLGNTYYGYLKLDKDGYMEEIKEKESYTSNRMEEYASAGTYYLRNGGMVRKYFAELLEKKINKNGEYYVSLVYNLMQRDGLRTHIYELEYFLQWGTPMDLQEYQFWSDYFSKDRLNGKAMNGQEGESTRKK
ncbi:MAG: glycosyltransferase family 2 protein [Candidatus Micrarchaeia archaeon]|jgi:NDP-sugar pyrophosphorylase family protein